MELHGSLKKSSHQSGREFSLVISKKLAKNSKNYGSAWSIIAKHKGSHNWSLGFSHETDYLGNAAILVLANKVHGKNFFKKNIEIPLCFLHHETYQLILCALCWCHCLRHGDVWTLQTLTGRNSEFCFKLGKPSKLQHRSVHTITSCTERMK